tara:strand:- start:15 stop:599 length:585 start_codon:yes stop_codon:yes gene_type:complete
MDRTAAIQTEREFEISEFELWSANNVKYEGELGRLVMAIEECEAQKVVYKLSVGYANMLTGEDDYQYSLFDEYEGAQAIPFENFRHTSDYINRDLICDNHQHSAAYKAQFGCEILYDGKTPSEIKKENQLKFGTSGVIPYQSDVLDKYHEFLKGYGSKKATIEGKLAEELEAKELADQLLADNNFYQNSLKNYQ